MKKIVNSSEYTHFSPLYKILANHLNNAFAKLKRTVTTQNRHYGKEHVIEP